MSNNGFQQKKFWYSLLANGFFSYFLCFGLWELATLWKILDRPRTRRPRKSPTIFVFFPLFPFPLPFLFGIAFLKQKFLKSLMGSKDKILYKRLRWGFNTLILLFFLNFADQNLPLACGREWRNKI